MAFQTSISTGERLVLMNRSPGRSGGGDWAVRQCQQGVCNRFEGALKGLCCSRAGWPRIAPSGLSRVERRTEAQEGTAGSVEPRSRRMKQGER